MLWVDKENLTVHAEAGIIGQDLEHEVCECVGLEYYDIIHNSLHEASFNLSGNIRGSYMLHAEFV